MLSETRRRIHSLVLLIAFVCVGCNAEHGTPYWIESQHGGPPPQITKGKPDGTTTLVYIATAEEIENAVKQQDWSSADNQSIVLLTRGGSKRDKCQLTGSTTSATRPLQITYFGEEKRIAQVKSLDEATLVLTRFLENDPQWQQALQWNPTAKEE